MTENQARIEPSPTVVHGGVDTHLDFHVVAAVNALGALLGTAVFATTAPGYTALLRWLQAWGPLASVGVEGTGSYGAALARHLTTHDITVLEVNRPDRASRRRRGKTDAYDAEAAARTVLAAHHHHPHNNTHTHAAKINHGAVESLRILKMQRNSAVKHRTASLNQMHQLRVTAPVELRERLRPLTKNTLPAHCARLRVDPTQLHDPLQAAKKTLRALARRVLGLNEEIAELDTDIATIVTAIAPTTLAAFGAGPETVAQLLITIGENPERFRNEAAFAALCGTSPIPASSGKTQRHRLNYGGDRRANSALHMIALSRLSHHPPTRAYIATRSTDTTSDPHLRRCLKRYIARELYPLLRNDLRALNGPIDRT